MSEMTHEEYIRRRDEIIRGCDVSNNRITPILDPQQAIDRLVLDVVGEKVAPAEDMPWPVTSDERHMRLGLNQTVSRQRKVVMGDGGE